jgi:hypothetical protein
MEAWKPNDPYIPTHFLREAESWVDDLKRLNAKTGIPQRVAKELSFFRYFKCANHPYGTNANNLDACIAIDDIQSLSSILDLLKLEGDLEINHNPKQLTGTRNLDGYKHLDNRLPEPLVASGFLYMTGYLVHVQISKTRLLITCSTKLPKYLDCEVSEEHVDAAHELEIVIVNSGLKTIDPPFNVRNYVCPYFHPTMFS